MAIEVIGTLTAGVGIAEIAVYGLAALGLLRHWGLTLAEAAAGAALFPAMLISFLLQASGLTGFPDLIVVARIAALAAAMALVWRHRGRLIADWPALLRFARHHTLAVIVLLTALGTLAVVAVAVCGHCLPREVSAPSSFPALIASPLKVARLVWGEVRGPCFPGAGFTPWMAYLSICFATYALARRYAWPPTAITVTLLVASMPRLVFLSVTRAVEIIPAAAAILFILQLYRTVERPDIKDLLLLAVVLIFGLSAGRMGIAFTALGCGLAVAVLYRRHGGRIWWDLVRAAPLPVAAAGLPLFIFAQGGLLAGWHWADGAPSMAGGYNADGLMGATANLLRYGLLAIDLTPPVEQGLEKIFGYNWNGLRLWVHDHLLASLFHPERLTTSFIPVMPGDRALAWFGPFAGLLFLPAVVWALLRGPRRLKSLALTLAAYFALVGLIPVWMPGNVRYFTVFFVCAGFTAAFLLPPWRMTRRRRRFLQVSAMALFAYAVGAVYWDMWVKTGWWIWLS